MNVGDEVVALGTYRGRITALTEDRIIVRSGAVILRCRPWEVRPA